MKRAEVRFDMERENENEKERVWWQEQEQGQDELAILLSFGVGAVSARALDASLVRIAGHDSRTVVFFRHAVIGQRALSECSPHPRDQLADGSGL